MKRIIILFVVFVFVFSGCGNATKDSTVAEEPSQQVASKEQTEFEVQISPSGNWNGTSAVFNIDTNLPDETELMLTLSQGDYNTDESFTAQTKVTIIDGKGVSEGFSKKGEQLSGNYDLSISMSIPSTQTDAVRAVIGEKGEFMTGSLVSDSGYGSNVVDALFAVECEKEIRITPSEDYQFTIFADE